MNKPYGKYVGYTLNLSGFLIGLDMVGPMSFIYIAFWFILCLLITIPIAVFDLMNKRLIADGVVGIILAFTGGGMAALGVIYAITFSIHGQR